MRLLAIGFSEAILSELRRSQTIDTVFAYSPTESADLRMPGRSLYAGRFLDDMVATLPRVTLDADDVRAILGESKLFNLLALDRPNPFARRTTRDHYDTLVLCLEHFMGLFSTFRPDVVIFSNVPHESAALGVASIAKFTNTHIVTCMQSLFPGRFFLTSGTRCPGDIVPRDKLFRSLTFDFPAVPPTPFYMLPRQNAALPQRVARRLRSTYGSVRHVIAASSYAGALQRLATLMHAEGDDRAHLRALHSSTKLAPGPDSQYIYFPLHLDPEMTTVPLGDVYWNQFDALAHLAKRVPPDWSIVVKENPKQDGYGRSQAWLLRLKQLPQVHAVSADHNTIDLIRNSRFVATVTGTAGWEALQLGKAVMTFGHAWYSSLPGAFRHDAREAEDLTQLASMGPELDALARAFEALSEALGVGVVDGHYSRIVDGFDAEANATNVVRSLLTFMGAHGIGDTPRA